MVKEIYEALESEIERADKIKQIEDKKARKREQKRFLKHMEAKDDEAWRKKFPNHPKKGKKKGKKRRTLGDTRK